MEKIIINKGFELKGLYVPQFNLCQGEYLSLNFLRPYDPKEETLLVEILTGKKIIPTVTIKGLISFIDPNFKHSFFHYFFKSKKVWSYMNERMNLSKKHITTILDNQGINPDADIYSLGLNEKALIALEIAYTSTKNIIINCSGLDYSGMYKLRQRIVQDLTEGSVIELNYLNSKGREYLFSEDFSFKRNEVNLIARV